MEDFHGTQVFYSGLLQRARELLDAAQVEYEVVHEVEDPPQGPLPSPEEIANCLPGITLHDHQIKGVQKALVTKRGIIDAATGSGKTEIILAIAKLLGHKTLVLVTGLKGMATVVRRCKKYGIEAGEFFADQRDLSKQITVAVDDSLFNAVKRGSREFRKFAKRDCQILMLDECLQGDTRILLQSGDEVPIADLVECGFPVKVMSYNHLTNTLEPREVLRFFKQSHTGFWRRVNGRVLVTDNHKIWSTSRKDYVRADQLGEEDVLKTFPPGRAARMCPDCGAVLSLRDYGGHRASHVEPFIRLDGAARHRASERMKKSNPWASPIVRTRLLEHLYNLNSDPRQIARTKRQLRLLHQNESRSQRETRIRRFMQAPTYRVGKKTSLEEKIQALGLPLRYTGDGSRWVAFRADSTWSRLVGRRRKNPDFEVIGNRRKVVEVGDDSYWWKEDQIKAVVESYAQVGIDCLFIRGSELLTVPESVLDRLLTFIHNHDEPFQPPYRTKVGQGKPCYRYNLEVEGNHNFVANGLLVSNCHHLPSNTWSTSAAFIEAPYRFGFSGSPFASQDDLEYSDMQLIGLTGEVLVRV